MIDVLSTGAVPQEDGSVFFKVWAPHFTGLRVEFTSGSILPLSLDSIAHGYFAGRQPHCPADLDYFYTGENGERFPDPASNYQGQGIRGPSQIVDHNRYRWNDTGWKGRELHDLVLYELHIGTFTPEGTFKGAANLIPYLADLGITGIELMPVAQFSGRRNWGYDGVFPFAPHNTYGTPDDLKALVDTAHQHGIAVLLDVVYNHIGPEGSCLGEFGPYFTDRYITPWGDAINYDGPFCDPVRSFFIENLLHWITRYHIDGFRIDAVQAVYDSSPVHILTEMCRSVQLCAQKLGRRVLMIAESDANDPRIVEQPKVRGYGFDAQWSDDFHLAAHAYLSGERHGLYQDFGMLEDLQKALTSNFVFDGKYSEFRCKHYGAPAAHLPPTSFVVFNQNHDHIGNRAGADRFAAISPVGKQKLALSLLLLSPFVPMLFMGEEYGETSPFHYFIDHQDPDLIKLVNKGRIRDLRRLWAAPHPPEPHALETFNASRLTLGRRFSPAGQALINLVKDLLRIRASVISPALESIERRVKIDLSRNVLSLEFSTVQEPLLLAVYNMGRQTIPRQALIPAGWEIELATSAERYSADGHHHSNSGQLAPLTAHICIPEKNSREEVSLS